MTRRPLARFLFSLALAIPIGAAAQNIRHRPTNPVVPAGDVITILQTTDIHDHVNGSGHVGLDVDPVTGMGSSGAYARIAGYISSVRATAGHHCDPAPAGPALRRCRHPPRQAAGSGC